MDREDWQLLSAVVIVFISLFVAGFAMGKKHEDNRWRKLVPDAMYQLCTECYQEGKESYNEQS